MLPEKEYGGLLQRVGVFLNKIIGKGSLLVVVVLAFSVAVSQNEEELHYLSFLEDSGLMFLKILVIRFSLSC